MNITEAIELVELRRAGKLIGFDEDEVMGLLLEELKKSRMTLRDSFAAKAIRIDYVWDFTSSDQSRREGFFQNMAKTAYAIADAMLAERKEKT